MFGTPPLLISPVTPPSCCVSNKMNLRKDFDGFSDEYEVIESLSSGASSKSMYGAADRPSPAPDASYNRVNVFGNVSE